MEALKAFIRNKEGPFEEYRDKIEVMMGSGSYEWAADTLLGIYDHIEEHGRISDRQKEAVDNIQKSIYERKW